MVEKTLKWAGGAARFTENTSTFSFMGQDFDLETAKIRPTIEQRRRRIERTRVDGTVGAVYDLTIRIDQDNS